MGIEIETKTKFTLKSRLQSFVYAIKGIVFAFKHERSIWLQSVGAIGTITAGFLFKISQIEWIAVVLCVGIVIACEIINTAIETIVDFISPEYHKKAGIIKDLAAGAVLTTAITSAVVAAIIFIPKIIALF